MSLESLTPQPADPLLRVIGQFRADPRPDKIDLGVGVFRDGSGHTPVMQAVKRAELRLHAAQDSKQYLGTAGDEAFVALLGKLALGPALTGERATGVQTPGGTGAIRLAAEMLAVAGVARIWVALPSWANHTGIFERAGLVVAGVPVFDGKTQRIDFNRWMQALGTASPGDAVLLHGCCHNPTGIDPTPEQWQAIADLVAARGLIPLIDLAYQGLGSGWQADAAGAQRVLDAARYGLLAYSCDKNFGLYRERTGALWATAPDGARAEILRSNLLSLARINWSMPPDHGAAVVRIVLDDPVLTALWRDEMDAMRERLVRLRRALAAPGRVGDLDLGPLAQGQGMFATLPLAPSEVAWLREARGIYLVDSGRINIAGFDEAGIVRFHQALYDLAMVPA